MNDPAEQITGIALRCEPGGRVLDVVYDTVGTDLRPGHSLTEALTTESVRSALSLLADASRDRVGHASYLGILPTDGTREDLRFIGCAAQGGDEVVLVGASSRRELAPLVEAIAPDLPDVVDQLDWLSQVVRREAEDEAVLSAFSETNNELAGMHRELARTNARLEALNRRKDEILGMVAHDLRNPLGTILGFSEVLVRHLDDTLDDRSKLMLTRIQHQSHRMLTLVEDLLDATAIATGQVTLDLAETDIHELLVETVDTYRYTASRKQITLELQCDGSPSIAWADSHRLMQVFDNLLSNAIKFSPDRTGATVTIRCRAIGADHLVVTVADEGIGIPDEVIAKLFQPFATTTTGTRNEHGTGLGLTITRSIVEAHGGHIDVRSEVDRGTSFEVVLPIRPPGSPTDSGMSG